MSLRMQGMLLRFLETGELQKVGADRVGRRIDVRVIAATNRDLAEMVAQGLFREDLYYRINVINIHVPPLRERRDDIPLLVDHFFENMGRHNGSRPAVSPEAYVALAEYPWPGNVRELANVDRTDPRVRLRARDSAPTTCRSRFGRRAASASGRNANAGGRWPTTCSSG